MKTVIDAVNELKGECDYYENYFYCGSRINKLNSGVIQSTLKPIYNTSWDAVCTRQKFLATVAECETNFGKCEQSYSDYTIAFVSMDNLNKSFSDKELDMDIDWSKYDVEALLKDKPTPIFTKEMADNGSPLAVGMSAIIRGETRVILLPADCDGDYITKCKGGLYEFDSINQFKPLTPPKTDKEKLIEEFQNALHDAFGTHTADDWSSIEDIASDLFDSFLIQPLTVEVK